MNCFAGGSQVRRKPDERAFDVVVDIDPVKEVAVFFVLLPLTMGILADWWMSCFFGFGVGLEDIAITCFCFATARRVCKAILVESDELW